MLYFTKVFKWVFYTLLTAFAFCFVYFGSAEASQKKTVFIAEIAPKVQLILFDKRGTCDSGLQAVLSDLQRGSMYLLCWDLDKNFVVVTWLDGTRTAYHVDKFQMIHMSDL